MPQRSVYERDAIEAILDEAVVCHTAKVRRGGPVDEEDDYELPVWAGTIGLQLIMGESQPDARLVPGVERPAYVDRLAQR